MSAMRIHILSDLHLEHASFAYSAPALGTDLVILAGDISSASEIGQQKLRGFLSEVCNEERNVVLILGNHDFYGTDIDTHLKKLRVLEQDFPRFVILERETVAVEGLTISGCTLWTDFSMESSGNGGIRAEACVADFKHIGHSGKAISWKEMADRYVQSVNFLKTHAHQSDIVVTHFLPSPRSIARKHEYSNLNSYFATDLSNLISQVNGLWVHGHTHSSCDYTEGTCRVVCNPRGYGRENHEFDKHLIVTLDNERSIQN